MREDRDRQTNRDGEGLGEKRRETNRSENDLGRKLGYMNQTLFGAVDV